MIKTKKTKREEAVKENNIEENKEQDNIELNCETNSKSEVVDNGLIDAEKNDDNKVTTNQEEINENDDISQIVDDNSFQEKINQSKQVIKKDKAPQKKVWSFVFVVINVVIVVAILLNMLNREDYVPLVGINFNYMWLAFALLCFLGMMLAEMLRFFLLIKKSTKMKRPILAYKAAAYGRYYDFITPFSTGGQPFQAYYFASRGLKASHSVSIPIAKYIVHQIVFALFSVVVLIIAFSNSQMPTGLASNLVQVACWIGFACNFVIVALVIMLSVGSFGKRFVMGILKLLHKMKIVKNYNEQYSKLLKTVEEYQKTIKFFSKSPILLIEMVVLSLLYMFIQYCVPFFIYCGFGGEPTASAWFISFSAALMIDLASSFIPLPGGSGIAELSFTALFASLFAGASFWALLFWRCITYYGFVLQGLLLVLYDAFVGNKKNKRMQAYFRRRYRAYYNRYVEEEEEKIVRRMEGGEEDKNSTLNENENNVN